MSPCCRRASASCDAPGRVGVTHRLFSRQLPTKRSQGIFTDRLQHAVARLRRRPHGCSGGSGSCRPARRGCEEHRSPPVPTATISSAASSVKPPTKTRQAGGRAPARRIAQQVVAPGDGVAHRLLARGWVAPAAGQQWQALLAGGPSKRRGGSSLDARGRQLDRQRQAVQPAADLGHGRRRCPASRRSRAGTACARSTKSRTASRSASCVGG